MTSRPLRDDELWVWEHDCWLGIRYWIQLHWLSEQRRLEPGGTYEVYINEARTVEGVLVDAATHGLRPIDECFWAHICTEWPCRHRRGVRRLDRHGRPEHRYHFWPCRHRESAWITQDRNTIPDPTRTRFTIYTPLASGHHHDLIANRGYVYPDIPPATRQWIVAPRNSVYHSDSSGGYFTTPQGEVFPLFPHSYYGLPSERTARETYFAHKPSVITWHRGVACGTSN